MQTYNLVGAGGTGSLLMPVLLKYLDSHHGEDDWYLQVIDGDHFSAANADRQQFPMTHVDENKARTLVETYAHAKTKAIDEYVGPDNVDSIVMEHDITLIAADNYTVRAHLNDHLRKLNDGFIINGGNEELDGSCQIYWRNEGANKLPPLDHLHPEIAVKDGEDRALMDCMTVAALPGGGQTVIANLMSATIMLNALRMVHDYLAGGELTVHEIHFDLATSRMKPADWRKVEGWQ